MLRDTANHALQVGAAAGALYFAAASGCSVNFGMPAAEFLLQHVCAAVVVDWSMWQHASCLGRARDAAVQVANAHGDSSDILCVDWCSHSDMLATGGQNSELRIWDLRNMTAADGTPTPLHVLSTHVAKDRDMGVLVVEWSPTQSVCFHYTRVCSYCAAWCAAMSARQNTGSIQPVTPTGLW
jgi:WD40 repeat protein